MVESIDKKTGYLAATGLSLKRGFLAPANFLGHETPGMEATARWNVLRARDLTWEHGSFPFGSRVRKVHSGKEGPGIRMRGTPNDRLCVAYLDNFPQIHDGSAVADITNEGEVMRNEHAGKAECFRQTSKKPEQAGPNGYVQHGNRFISHQKDRFQNDGPGDGNALPLTATQFMRILGVELFRGPELRAFKGLANSLFPYYPVAEAVDLQRLTDSLKDGETRIERFIGVLKNHLGLAAEIQQGFPFITGDVLSLEKNLTRGWSVEAYENRARSGFA